MIKYENNEAGKRYLEVRGSSTDIGCDIAYMIALIYKDLFKRNPAVAASFRRWTMYVINAVMDAIERGELNDNYIA